MILWNASIEFDRNWVSNQGKVPSLRNSKRYTIDIKSSLLEGAIEVITHVILLRPIIWYLLQYAKFPLNSLVRHCLRCLPSPSRKPMEALKSMRDMMEDSAQLKLEENSRILSGLISKWQYPVFMKYLNASDLKC